MNAPSVGLRRAAPESTGTPPIRCRAQPDRPVCTQTVLSAGRRTGSGRPHPAVVDARPAVPAWPRSGIASVEPIMGQEVYDGIRSRGTGIASRPHDPSHLGGAASTAGGAAGLRWLYGPGVVLPGHGDTARRASDRPGDAAHLHDRPTHRHPGAQLVQSRHRVPELRRTVRRGRGALTWILGGVSEIRRVRRGDRHRRIAGAGVPLDR
jgi:hypothetical protein